VADKTTPVTEPVETKRSRLGWLSTTVAIVFGLLYAYDIWEAINNAIELPKAYEQLEALGVTVGEVPWTLIIANMLIPPVVYVFAFVLGMRRNVFGKAVLFAVGLALVAVLSLDIVAIA
jgi:uncharacterized membrane protein